MRDPYPPVKQFETIRREADQLVQLRQELREASGRRVPSSRRRVLADRGWMFPLSTTDRGGDPCRP